MRCVVFYLIFKSRHLELQRYEECPRHLSRAGWMIFVMRHAPCGWEPSPTVVRAQRSASTDAAINEVDFAIVPYGGWITMRRSSHPTSRERSFVRSVCVPLGM